MSIINEILHKVHGTKILRDRKPTALYSSDVASNETLTVDYLRPELIVMSEDTYIQILREDYSGVNVSPHTSIQEPRRFQGIRVAFDNSLPLGKILMAEEVFG